MTQVILPKPWLSWSQKTCWDSSPSRYRREYFEGGPKLDTKYLRNGKGFAKLVEDMEVIQKTLGTKQKAIEELVRLYHISDELKSVLEDLDTDGISEYKMECLIQGVNVLSFIDKYVPQTNEFREYKTGKIPWTQAKVQKHDQLVLYALMLRTLTGKTPEGCYLDWIETVDNKKGEDEEPTDFWREKQDQVKFTGKIKTFYRQFDERELDRMEESILKTATEISDAYRNFIEEI